MAEREIGGWEEVPNSIQIEDLARFAVDEYNLKETASLVFVRVTRAYRQVVAGFMYRINLEATDDGETNYYVTKIIEKPGVEEAEVLEFEKLLGSNIGGSTGDLEEVPISDEIENLARFVVDQQNIKENGGLVFVRAIRAYSQVVAGAIIYIILEATEHGTNYNYQTKIFEGLDHVKEVLEFFRLIAPVEIDQ